MTVTILGCAGFSSRCVSAPSASAREQGGRHHGKRPDPSNELANVARLLALQLLTHGERRCGMPLHVSAPAGTVAAKEALQHLRVRVEIIQELAVRTLPARMGLEVGVAVQQREPCLQARELACHNGVEGATAGIGWWHDNIPSVEGVEHPNVLCLIRRLNVLRVKEWGSRLGFPLATLRRWSHRRACVMITSSGHPCGCGHAEHAIALTTTTGGALLNRGDLGALASRKPGWPTAPPLPHQRARLLHCGLKAALSRGQRRCCCCCNISGPPH
eukprot:NODE_2325_length_955_cov_307.111111.p1 GENE.NODE_2325_length_955_cov_307.111111~~NODE_2325_length_955_cov_307.111111.p1  ORF type:complete len:292 (-),score=69.34 NODE_2325_length_955_cov_307.111111:78-896(-)